MNFANLLFWRKPKLAVQPVPSSKRTEEAVFKTKRPIRVGSWVVSPEGAGIVVAQDSTSFFVTLVSPAGESLHTLQFATEQIRRAAKDEIPVSRGGTV